MVIYYVLTFIRAENVFKGRRPAQSGEFWTCSIPVSTLDGLTYVKVFYTMLNTTLNTMFYMQLTCNDNLPTINMKQNLNITCTMSFELFLYYM